MLAAEPHLVSTSTTSALSTEGENPKRVIKGDALSGSNLI